MQKTINLKLFNSLGRQLKEFMPITPGKAGLYACGLTVYNYAHIGNLRTYIFEDILRRTLEYIGYDVRHVMNITDVGHLTDDADEGEDKMLVGARRSGKSVWEIADHYTKAFFQDLDALNILRPSIICKATDHIQDMIDLIKRIEKNGFTYFAGGNLYFDIGKLADYGKLAGLNLEDLKAGARIELDKNKKNPHDFVLWFTRSKFEHQSMLWDSPWGKGYPGWHIECSAMSMRYLGEEFDIHCGGVDHINVHHTNEIAQSEAATGKKWVRYWLHAEFLILAREKMSKSLGNFITLESLGEQGYDPLDYRYFCLGAHYRTQLQFSLEALKASRTARLNLMERIAYLKKENNAEQAEPPGGQTLSYLQSFHENMAADLNMPKCLSDLWNLLKDNEVEPHQKLLAALEMDKVLGLKLKEAKLPEVTIDERIKRLIEERTRARKHKNFTRADQIRTELEKEGIILEDTPDGVHFRKKMCNKK